MHKRKKSKERAFTSGTLNFSRIEQAHEGKLLSLAILQRKPSYLFLFTRWSFSLPSSRSHSRGRRLRSISGDTAVAGSEQQGGGKPWPTRTRIGLGSFAEAWPRTTAAPAARSRAAEHGGGIASSPAMADAEGCDGAARQGHAGGHEGPARPHDSGGTQLGQRQHELELRSAMAATALGASGSAREGVNEGVGSGNAREGGEGRSGARLWRSKSATEGRARGQRRAAMVEASSRMAATHGARVAP